VVLESCLEDGGKVRGDGPRTAARRPVSTVPETATRPSSRRPLEGPSPRARLLGPVSRALRQLEESPRGALLKSVFGAVLETASRGRPVSAASGRGPLYGFHDDPETGSFMRPRNGPLEKVFGAPLETVSRRPRGGPFCGLFAARFGGPKILKTAARRPVSAVLEAVPETARPDGPSRRPPRDDRLETTASRRLSRLPQDGLFDDDCMGPVRDPRADFGDASSRAFQARPSWPLPLSV